MIKKEEDLKNSKFFKVKPALNERQPFKIPENWVWTRLSTINNYKSESLDPKKYTDTIFELYSVPSFERHYPELITGNEIGSTKQMVQEGDVLLCKINPRINRVWNVKKFTNNQLIASSEWIIIRNEHINSNYLMYCLRSQYFRQLMLSNVSGVGGSLMRAQPKNVMEYIIPIPPSSEQQKIVEIIEKYLSKLDMAKEIIENALDSFENRKVAILHQAFSGELTKKWRKDQEVNMESWEIRKIKEVCYFRAGYAFDSKKFTDKGYQIIRMGNLYNGILDLSRKPVYITKDELDEKIIIKSKIHSGDILLTLTGTKYKRDYGYAVLMEDENEILLNQRIVAMTPKKINTKFLLYLLKSENFREIFFSNETGGVNQGNVSSKFVENIEIVYPSLSEQDEIARILDNIIEKEQEAKNLVDILGEIELMKKAILDKAFRGKLGTNKENEESAIKLLEEIIRNQEGK